MVLFWVLLLVNEYVWSSLVLLRVFLTISCYFSIRLFYYVFFVAIFCSEIVFFPCHLVVGMCLWNLTLILGRIFLHYFKCPIYSVLSCLYIFLVFRLLSPVRSDLLLFCLFYSCCLFFFVRTHIPAPLLLFTPLEFFTSVLADGFSLKLEWQQVSSSLQDSSQDSSRSQQCCRLDSLYPSANFQVLQALK